MSTLVSLKIIRSHIGSKLPAKVHVVVKAKIFQLMYYGILENFEYYTIVPKLP